MPAARARKSSTSSGRPRRPRPRYLGLEAAGREPFPPSSSAWAARLSDARVRAGAGLFSFRVVRAEGPRAVVEVEARDLPAARSAWNLTLGPSAGVTLRTWRSWGTLLGAKAWLAEGRGTPTRRPDAYPS